ncbi:MAG: AraC family transcriptional regulator [Bacteroidales bacterium]|nr:AraC family transcriptional regulator [Bacteroidales bacterium]
MPTSDNFINKLESEIKENGVFVIDDVTRMPAYDRDFVQPYYSVGINHRGTVEGSYDGTDFSFSPHDISVLYPRHTIYVRNSSPDYRATLIVISEQLFSELNSINTSDNRFVFESQPHFKLNDRQFADILTIVEVFRVINRLNYVNRKEMMVIMLDVLLGIIGNYRIENVGKGGDGKNRLSPLLRDAIMQHCHQHHDVEFYAGLFCLSAKHFSTVVKRETGFGVNHWIQQQLVSDAKTLLRTELQAPIQDISDRLGFPDLATFSRFFKRETGVSPTTFRQSL